MIKASHLFEAQKLHSGISGYTGTQENVTPLTTCGRPPMSCAFLLRSLGESPDAAQQVNSRGLPSSAPSREITAAKPGSQVGQGTADEAMAGERAHGWVWLRE